MKVQIMGKLNFYHHNFKNHTTTTSRTTCEEESAPSEKKSREKLEVQIETSHLMQVSHDMQVESRIFLQQQQDVV